MESSLIKYTCLQRTNKIPLRDLAGKQKFEEHLTKVAVNNTSAISDTIKNNRTEIFLTSESKKSLKLHQKLK